MCAYNSRRILGPAGRPDEMLQAAVLAARIATAIDDQALLGRARNKQGIALVKVGRLTEATLAQAEAWSLAREAADKDRELDAVWGFSTISVAMGQWKSCNPLLRAHARTRRRAWLGSARIYRAKQPGRLCASTSRFSVGIGYAFQACSGRAAYQNLSRYSRPFAQQSWTRMAVDG